MYILRNREYPDLYWSEIERKWTNKESASLFYSEDDASHALHDVGSKDLTMLVCVLEEVENNEINASSVKRMGDDGFHCDPSCPYLKEGKCIDADCTLLKRSIPWYDWHIAICYDLLEDASA